MQKAIEVEYWVIDRDGSLTDPGPLLDVSEYVVPEFVEPLVELKTPPCESVEQLQETFLSQLEELLSVAEANDRLLVPLGTPISDGSIRRRDSDRGDIQEKVIGTDFEYAKHCAGTHFHFEQRNVVDQLNLLISLDPALSLVNSSPYYRGEWVADSARAFLYRKKSYAGYPRHGRRWDYVHTVPEWQERLECCFEAFRDDAVSAGIDERLVDEHFSPDTVVWTPVRLRGEMPTVEWRAPDASLPSEILRLLADVERLMEHIHHTNVAIGGNDGGISEDRITLPSFERVADLGELAIHEGVASDAVVSYLDRMGFDVGAYAPLSKRFEDRNNVSAAEARRLRLNYGKLLRRDVDALRE